MKSDALDLKQSEVLQNDVIEYLRALSLCHTVTIDRSSGYDTYNAASPDELAFCQFTEKAGM
jgi:magnesium-transporting ATPase (P-type)